MNPNHGWGGPAGVPTAHLAALIEGWLAGGGRSVACLAGRSGVSERRIRMVLSGERPNVPAGTVDRLLVAMDRVEAWHTHLADPPGSETTTNETEQR
jgi:hypothetical protein